MTREEKIELIKELTEGLDEHDVYRMTDVDLDLTNLEALTDDELDRVLDCEEL